MKSYDTCKKRENDVSWERDQQLKLADLPLVANWIKRILEIRRW